ncbi:MAG: hypothetical protein GEV12_18250 [Micromonosporaceae bacterium]|nr:hypothetical protein [Micromonosporaceae bacterium]
MGMSAVFPDWSPYRDLEAAARAYLRDPDVAMDALSGVLIRTGPFGFTLERFVNEVNGVWQEVAVCDGDRLVLWHGEDVAPGNGPPGGMTSSLRVVPLSSVTEVGCRRRLMRTGQGQAQIESVDVYLLLGTLDEAAALATGPGEASAVRHDALRFGKTLADGGPGQIVRVEEFAQLIASLVGRRPAG